MKFSIEGKFADQLVNSVPFLIEAASFSEAINIFERHLEKVASRTLTSIQITILDLTFVT